MVEHKYYVRDVGDVCERTVKGGSRSACDWSPLTHLPRP